MAAGDVFSNVNIPIALSSSVTVRPASGVEIMISSIWGVGEAGASAMGINMINSTGTTTKLSFGSVIGGTAEARYAGNNIKWFFTNTQYFELTAGAGDPTVGGYSGIQIK